MSLLLDILFWLVNVGMFAGGVWTVWHNLKQ